MNPRQMSPRSRNPRTLANLPSTQQYHHDPPPTVHPTTTVAHPTALHLPQSTPSEGPPGAQLHARTPARAMIGSPATPTDTLRLVDILLYQQFLAKSR